MRKLFIGLISATTIGFALHTGAQAQEANWSYNGNNGPSAWHTLGSANAICRTGQFQSPINIEGTEPAVMRRLETNYTVTPIDLTNNRLSIHMRYDAGSSLQVGAKSYALEGAVFHTPAEHTVANKTFPMSIQFMHTATDGKRAVVVSLIEEGAENKAITEFMPHLPLEPDQRNRRADVFVNARDLMPSNKDYYRYTGSLTTPPCTEGVSWYILKKPVQFSAEQILLIKGVIGGDNARPMQQRGNRIILDARGQ
ncbi:carbonic anhydrase [Kordiimonas aquimaris]|uniref:carbonic anhydrase n=1 Tax=Kordiimonas aquimaris TaxID=707591 RepID=UPI0021D0A06F|nr:carbonic anhydrase family protein [Kordiimonas aquimaris]